MTINTTLLYPAFILMILTIMSLFVLLFARVVALRGEYVNKDHFKSMNFDANKNKWLIIASRHYENLGILSNVFYICIVLIVILQYTNTTYIILAWLFIGFRFIHSIIHLTYNNVLQRMAAFLISNCFLITIVLLLIIQVSSTNFK
ncbi:MAG: hypothetical protein ACJA0H_001705 [Francisellaceae bacterium]|jgi:hypothetical protein